MGALLVRPYPIAELDAVGELIAAAVRGDIAPLQRLYLAARHALERTDPDEVLDLVLAYPTAGELDKVALRAATEEFDAWEAIVTIGSSIVEPERFRGFAWSCASARYLDRRPGRSAFRRFAEGAPLHGLSLDDTALYALLPALIGLGPDMPLPVPGPIPAPTEPAWRRAGLPDDDWSGIDPLDGDLIDADACAGAAPTAPPAWRALLELGAAHGGLVVRRDNV